MSKYLGSISEPIMDEVEALSGFPRAFPYSWVKEWGEDEKGIWAAFMFEGVQAALRWIPPGTFKMGSPKQELGRDEDEKQHPVTLSQGFWMGETPVTQALWQAVMSVNPSQFKGDDFPVERVSWHDTQDFLKALNERQEALELRLPTEVEWEYACRARSITPFHFGVNIDTDQVNYDGDRPYAKGKKGLGRRKMVPVKELPANAWGLYQMHGNIWEWCNDYYRTYQSSDIDLLGAEVGANRVLRGGSWNDDCRYVRSAYRYWYNPKLRTEGKGFRLARGHAP